MYVEQKINFHKKFHSPKICDEHLDCFTERLFPVLKLWSSGKMLFPYKPTYSCTCLCENTSECNVLIGTIRILIRDDFCEDLWAKLSKRKLVFVTRGNFLGYIDRKASQITLVLFWTSFPHPKYQTPLSLLSDISQSPQETRRLRSWWTYAIWELHCPAPSPLAMTLPIRRYSVPWGAAVACQGSAESDTPVNC